MLIDAMSPISMGRAANMNRCGRETFLPMRKPPNKGPTMEPKRPIPNAQPTPLERNAVGYSRPDAALLPNCAPRVQNPATAIADAVVTYEMPGTPIAAIAG